MTTHRQHLPQVEQLDTADHAELFHVDVLDGFPVSCCSGLGYDPIRLPGVVGLPVELGARMTVGC